MAVNIGRREFIITLSGAAAAWPLAARAQQAGKIWRIGYIVHERLKHFDALFEQLRQLGYVEGQNIIVERRYAQGRAERFEEFAAEMVRLKADVIIVNTTPAALALRNATTTIPIVIPTAIDPVGTGLIASLAHPGGNITGGALLSAELGAKRLELLKEVVTGLSRTAVLWNGANPANALAWRETEGAARALGVTLQSYDVQGPKDFNIAFATMAQQRPRGGPGCLNRFSASISGASARVRLPSGVAAGRSRLDRAWCRKGSRAGAGHFKSPSSGR